MKYPDANTTSRPVVGKEVKTLLEAVGSGRAMADERAATTIARILRKHGQSGHGQSSKKVRRRAVWFR